MVQNFHKTIASCRSSLKINHLFCLVAMLLLALASCNTNNPSSAVSEYVEADSAMYAFINERIELSKHTGFNEFDFKYSDIKGVQVKYTQDTLISSFNLNYGICIMDIVYNTKYKKGLLPKDSMEYVVHTAYEMADDVEKAWNGDSATISRTNSDPSYRYSRNNVCLVKIYLKNGKVHNTRMLLHKSDSVPFLTEEGQRYDIEICRKSIKAMEEKI